MKWKLFFPHKVSPAAQRACQAALRSVRVTRPFFLPSRINADGNDWNLWPDLSHPLPISQDIPIVSYYVSIIYIYIYTYLVLSSTTFSSSIRKAKDWLTMELTQPSWHRTKRVPISKVLCYFCYVSFTFGKTVKPSKPMINLIQSCRWTAWVSTILPLMILAAGLEWSRGQQQKGF